MILAVIKTWNTPSWSLGFDSKNPERFLQETHLFSYPTFSLFLSVIILISGLCFFNLFLCFKRFLSVPKRFLSLTMVASAGELQGLENFDGFGGIYLVSKVFFGSFGSPYDFYCAANIGDDIVLRFQSQKGFWRNFRLLFLKFGSSLDLLLSGSRVDRMPRTTLGEGMCDQIEFGYR